MRKVQRHEGGYTIVELIIVIVIIGIMAGLIAYLPIELQDSSNDQERYDDVTSIARQLELSYDNQKLGAPSYPSTQEMNADVSSRSRTMSKIPPDALKAPGSTSNSIVVAIRTSNSLPINGGVTEAKYVYQPLKRDGSLCNAANSTSSASTYCVRYVLYYYSVSGQTVKKIKSMHQQ